MKKTVAIPFILLAACYGCAHDNQARVFLPAHIEIAKPSFANQRFLTTNSADVAFDTQTGALCKTWEWRDVPMSDPSSMNNRTAVCSEIVRSEQREKDEREVAMADVRRGR